MVSPSENKGYITIDKLSKRRKSFSFFVLLIEEPSREEKEKKREKELVKTKGTLTTHL